MTEPARHLRAVDEDGVIVEGGCPNCSQLEDKLSGAERDLNTWRLRYAELKRDKLAEAKQSEHWPFAVELFAYWGEKCNHSNSAWTLDRFQMVEPFLKNRKYGKTIEERAALCRRAIDGIAFDPFITNRKNGTKKRHDGWHLIFDRGADVFEERCNAAPLKAVA